jgi:hypothetical protein
VINPFKLTKKSILNAQNNPWLHKFSFGDIFVCVQSIFAFIDIMKVVRFLLDGLHGIHNPKTFTNGKTTPEVKTTRCV